MEYLIYLVIITSIYILYKLHSSNSNKQENMENTQTVDELVSQNDLNNIKNYVDIIKTLETGNKELPTNLNILGELNMFTKGSIIIWQPGDYLTEEQIEKKVPNGWALCNGRNGTPDLRGRYIRMYSDNVDNKPVSWNDKLNTFDIAVPSEFTKVLGENRESHKSLIGKHKFNETGGSDFYKMKNTNFLPKHEHNPRITNVHYLYKNHNESIYGKMLDNDIYSNKIKRWSGSGHKNAYDTHCDMNNNFKPVKDFFENPSKHEVHQEPKGGNQAYFRNPPFVVMAFLIKI